MPSLPSRFRHLALAAVVVTVTVTGCATESNRDSLNGKWGGVGLGVTSSPDRAEIMLACGSAKLDSPLQANARGQIDVSAVVNEFYGSHRIRFQAQLLEGNLNVTLTEFYPNQDPEVEEFTLMAGTTPDFSGTVCPG